MVFDPTDTARLDSNLQGRTAIDPVAAVRISRSSRSTSPNRAHHIGSASSDTALFAGNIRRMYWRCIGTFVVGSGHKAALCEEENCVQARFYLRRVCHDGDDQSCECAAISTDIREKQTDRSTGQQGCGANRE